jgi:hypothetical protein
VRNIGRALFALAGLLGSAPAIAADLPTKKPAPVMEPAPALPSSWIFDLTLYGWALNMTGNAGVARFPTSPFFVSFDDILHHLDFVIFASLIARNDTFTGGLDFIWARVGTTVTYKDPFSPLYGTNALPLAAVDLWPLRRVQVQLLKRSPSTVDAPVVGLALVAI